MSIIVFKVLSKSLGSPSEGSKISLDISIERLEFGKGTSFSFIL